MSSHSMSSKHLNAPANISGSIVLGTWHGWREDPRMSQASFNYCQHPLPPLHKLLEVLVTNSQSQAAPASVTSCWSPALLETRGSCGLGRGRGREGILGHFGGKSQGGHLHNNWENWEISVSSNDWLSKSINYSKAHRHRIKQISKVRISISTIKMLERQLRCVIIAKFNIIVRILENFQYSGMLGGVLLWFAEEGLVFVWW